MRFYLVPREAGTLVNQYGPKYFEWRFDPDPPGLTPWLGFMLYGWIPYGLILADLSPADHATIILNTDVYAFPDNLDTPITDPNVDIFFEAINLPTDWLTPSTTYRQLLRYTAGMFQFNQRYRGIAEAAGFPNRSIFDGGRTLESNWNSLSAQEKTWFNDTVHSFGFPQNVTGNPKLRTLAKQAGDLWGTQPFIMGGIEF